MRGGALSSRVFCVTSNAHLRTLSRRRSNRFNISLSGWCSSGWASAVGVSAEPPEARSGNSLGRRGGDFQRGVIRVQSVGTDSFS